MITNQRKGFQVLEKDTLIGDTYTSHRDRERIHNCKPFLVNALRKGGQGISQVLARVCAELLCVKISWEFSPFLSMTMLVNKTGVHRS